MKLLKMLTQAAAPSGNEENVSFVIENEIASLVDELYKDTSGNLIAHIKGNGEKVMLDAHMDEIGIIVTFIEDNGLLRFSNLGGVSVANAISQRVRFLNGEMGVVFNEDGAKLEDLKLSDLYIDIGAKSKEEAETKIKVGDVACFEGGFTQTENRVVSKALDDRVGCYVLIETMKNIKEIKELKNDLYFVFCVSEELGLRGAKVAANVIAPDYAVSVDVTRTGDLPGKLKMAVKLGEGTAVKVKDSSVLCHPYIKDFMVKTCVENNISYQLEVLEKGGTNAGAIHLTNGGVPSGVISIPTRYIHSPSEMIDLGDVDASIKLLTKMIEKGFKM